MKISVFTKKMCLYVDCYSRTRGDAIGWDAALQAGWLQPWFPKIPFEFALA